MGGITDTHRSRTVIARQPRHLSFGHPALSTKPVHDLELRWTARNRAQQPIAPGLRLVVVAAVHQRHQGEGRIAQPTVAIVPITYPADPLRQGRGRSGRDSTRGRVGQRLQV